MESVDRNVNQMLAAHNAQSVALRMESVDRNGLQIKGDSMEPRSLSAWRAWIEM